MDVVNRFEHLLENFSCFLFGKLNTFTKFLKKLETAKIFLDKKYVVSILVVFDKFDNIWMI